MLVRTTLVNWKVCSEEHWGVDIGNENNLSSFSRNFLKNCHFSKKNLGWRAPTFLAWYMLIVALYGTCELIGIAYGLFQLLDEGKLQKADNLYEDFQTPESAHKM